MVRIILALLALVSALGCSPNKTLASRLKEADRVVVVNPRNNVSITVTGEEVGKIVKAIATGKKEPPNIAASPDLDLQFFKGDERLATVTTSLTVFWVEHDAYSDQTGTLEALEAKYREAHPPQFSP